jgi:hypothetical protein
MQSDKDEELMTVPRENADLEPNLTSDFHNALQLAEKSNPSTSTSQRATEPRRLVCSVFCGLAGSCSKRATWYPAEMQEQQEVLLRCCDHLITPHVLPHDSPLSRMFTNFKSAVGTMLQNGTPLDEVLGPLDPIVDLLFRLRQSNDLFSACTWASEVARILHVQIDIFTQFANAFLLARFMRWIIASSRENCLLLPGIMQTTAAQTRVPHHASADLYTLSVMRGALVKGSCEYSNRLGPAVRLASSSTGRSI